MGKNLELKIKVDSHTETDEILEKSECRLIDTLLQKDIYYRFDKGLLKLRIVNGRGELIKYNRDETASERWSDYNILNVNPDEAEKFFREIFDIEVTVTKTRILWLYNNTRIHLDDVAELGKYIELETVVRGNLDDARNEFNKVVDLLNLDIDNQLNTSYRNLLLEL